METKEPTQQHRPLPPGWDLKRSYRRNMLIGNLIILVAAFLTIALASLLRQKAPMPDLARNTDRPDMTVDTAFGQLGGENGDFRQSITRTSRYHEVLTIRQTRHIIIPDAPIVFETRAERTSEASEGNLQLPENSVADTSLSASGYLDRMSGIPQQQITLPEEHSYELDLRPVGRRHSRGFPTEPVFTNDIVSRPVIDVRWIRSPLLDKHRDTAVVLVDMLLGPDTLDIVVVEERPLFKGYGDLVVEGLRRGNHIPMIVNGRKCTTQVLLTIYLCLHCEEINLVAQTVDIRY